MECLETLFDAECWFTQTCSTLVPAFFSKSLFSTDDAWLRRVLLLRSWWNVFQAVLSNSTSLIQSLVVIFGFVVCWRRFLWHFVNWRVNEILDYLHAEPALLLLPSKFVVQHIAISNIHCNIPVVPMWPAGQKSRQASKSGPRLQKLQNLQGRPVGYEPICPLWWK